MKRNLAGALTVAAASLCSVSAYAADLGPYRPPAPVAQPYYEPNMPPLWRGAYIGLNGGYGWGDSTTDFSGPGFDASGSLNNDGWLGGGQIGYNAQFGAFVLGLESDIQASDLSDSASSADAAGFAGDVTTDIDWFSTLRARAGIAMDRTLLYVTGGFAFADVTSSAVATDGANSVALSGSGTETGYTIGGGLEYMLSPNWTAKAEYLYVDLGEQKLTGVGSDGLGYSGTNDIDFQTVRFGLNYKF